MSRAIVFGIGLVGLAVWAVLAILDAAPALQGWLIGFIFVSSLSIGSLTVELIQRLVGGRWGAAFAPELAPAARATPLLILFVLPVLIGLPLIYPWAADPSALKPGVHPLYLNIPFFALRTAVAVGGWSLIAWLLPRIEGPRGRLGAGLGLAFHGVAVSLIAVDWVLSVEPSWTSSDFGMNFAVQQLAAGFAFAALQARRRADEPSSGDIAGLMLATIIGLIYLEFMSFLVVWYGDRPSLDRFYIPRASWPWQVLPWASLALSAAAIVLLAARRAFQAHRAIAMVGGCVLLGLFCYQVWLEAPSRGGACLLPALFALIGQGGVWVAAATGAPRLIARSERLAHAA